MDFSDVDASEVEVEGGASQSRPEPPTLVPHRTLYGDADTYAYDVAHLDESLSKNIEQLKNLIQVKRIMAGAERIELHLTLGNKGGRYEIARVKEYQENRKKRDPLLVQRVSELRTFMANYTEEPTVIPAPQLEQEADDSLTQAMYKGMETDPNFFDPEKTLHVLESIDKDLFMTPGTHMNKDTWDLEVFPFGFGECELDRSGSQVKIKGRGTSFFWHQLLQGDGADNIPGLPKFAKEQVVKYWPTKKLVDARTALSTRKNPKGKQLTSKQLETKRTIVRNCLADAKDKLAGAVTVYEYLEGCTTDREAFDKVQLAYASWYGTEPFEFTAHDQKVEQSTSGHMLLEQARLLWMRRTEGEDVMRFFEEVMSNG